LLPAHKRTSSMTSIKREPSDLSTRSLSRPGLQKSVSFVGREIDLVADAKVYEAKKRKLDKLTTQKKELDAAIDALKKPNRSNVGREIMNEVEQRKLVQITATPSRKKARQLLKDMSLSIEDDAEVPSKDLDPVIPSSTIKPMLIPTIPRSSLKKRAVLAAISDTPSRGMTKLSNPLELSAAPALARDTVASTPATSRLRPDLPPPPTDTPLPTTKRSSKPVLFTPLKRSNVSIADSFRDAPVIPEEAGKAMDRVMGGKGMSEEIEMSTNIYEQLGWDEDDGDL
jgi:DNA replication regulator SLD3